jgi:hypothetical protein
VLTGALRTCCGLDLETEALKVFVRLLMRMRAKHIVLVTMSQRLNSWKEMGPGSG